MDILNSDSSKDFGDFGIFKYTLDQLPMGIVFIDRNGRGQYMNNEFINLFGYTQEDISSIDDWWLLAYPNEAERKQAKQGWLNEINDPGQQHFRERVVTCKNGTKKCIEIGGINSSDYNVILFKDITERKQQEDLLRDSESRYKTLAEAAFEGIVISKNGIVCDLNDQQAHILRYEREEWIGRSVYEMIAPEYREEVVEAIKNDYREPYNHEDITKDGLRVPVQVRGRSMQIGGETYRVSVIRDMTEQSAIQKELMATNARLNTLINMSPLSIIVFDKDRKITLWNPAAESMYGWTAQEVIGQTAPYITQGSEEDYNSFYNRILTGNGLVNELAKRVRKDGTPIFISVSAVVLKDEQNNATGIMSLNIDITDGIKAQDDLRRSEAFLNNILENSPHPMWITDDNATIIRVNKAMCDILNMDAEQVVGKYNVFHDNIAEAQGLFPLLRRVYENGEIAKYVIKWNSSEQIQPGFGQSAPAVLDSILVPVLDANGKVTHAIAQHLDITELKRTEEELENRVAERTKQLENSNRELEAFSYSVSHDLRTPLRAIDGFSQILLDDYADKLDEKGQEYLQRSRAAAGNMGHLIDDILRLSRITRADMKMHSVNLTELAESIVQEYMEREQPRHVDFKVQPGLYAMADPDLLKIAMENLISNAWKFTSRTENACIEFGSTVENDLEVFFIKDNGAGYDQAYSDKLFTVFSRLHKTIDFPGTGVGLATVKRVVNRHGGEVWAQGEVGKGATIYFTLKDNSKN